MGRARTAEQSVQQTFRRMARNPARRPRTAEQSTQPAKRARKSDQSINMCPLPYPHPDHTSHPEYPPYPPYPPHPLYSYYPPPYFPPHMYPPINQSQPTNHTVKQEGKPHTHQSGEKKDHPANMEIDLTADEPINQSTNQPLQFIIKHDGDRLITDIRFAELINQSVPPINQHAAHLPEYSNAQTINPSINHILISDRSINQPIDSAIGEANSAFAEQTHVDQQITSQLTHQPIHQQLVHQLINEPLTHQSINDQLSLSSHLLNQSIDQTISR